MERIKALIDKLYQQKEQGVSPSQLLPTVQLLQSELVRLQQKNGIQGTSKVAVTMPSQLNFNQDVVLAQPAIKKEDTMQLVAEVNPVIKPKEAEIRVPVQEPVIPKPEPVKHAEYNLQKPVSIEPVVSKEEPSRPVVSQSSFFSAFDTAEEAPTLIQHRPVKELHELIGESKESLNDKLKESKTELAHVLKDTPIKDLRKGIGINDRFTFVSELFRGDDAMYERSIKTINSFNILSEAEYWINRELKFKLGWNDNKEIVQHFYHLVRRRFA